jgi:hypothetical protein
LSFAQVLVTSEALLLYPTSPGPTMATADYVSGKDVTHAAKR